MTVLQLQDGTFIFETSTAEVVPVPNVCLQQSALLRDVIARSDDAAEVEVPVSSAALELWVSHVHAQSSPAPVRRALDPDPGGHVATIVPDGTARSRAADLDRELPIIARGTLHVAPQRQAQAGQCSTPNPTRTAPSYGRRTLGVHDTCMLLVVCPYLQIWLLPAGHGILHALLDNCVSVRPGRVVFCVLGCERLQAGWLCAG